MWYFIQIGVFALTLWFFGEVILADQARFESGQPQAMVLFALLASFLITKLAALVYDLFANRAALTGQQPINDNLSPSDVRLASKLAKLFNRIGRGKYLSKF
jgi:hypothetical protein